MTSPSSESERLRSYLQSQGEKYSFAEIWPRALKARLQLLDALEGVSEDQARFKPGADDWSISEVALHILNGSRGGRRFVEALARGLDPGSAEVEPARKSTDAPVQQLLAELREDGIEWTAAIARLPGRPSLQPTAPHPMFGPLHARAWFLFQRMHDLDHANQIEAVKRSPGYPAAAGS
jgi:hypothetical protein